MKLVYMLATSCGSESWILKLDITLAFQGIFYV